jgi:hypothetical protein
VTRTGPMRQEDYTGGGYVLLDYPDLLYDDLTAVCSRSDLDRLPHYQHSLPTGVYPGKVWKRLSYDPARPMRPRPSDEAVWLLGMFEEHEDPAMRGKLVRGPVWRDLLVID